MDLYLHVVLVDASDIKGELFLELGRIIAVVDSDGRETASILNIIMLIQKWLHSGDLLW